MLSLVLRWRHIERKTTYTNTYIYTHPDIYTLFQKLLVRLIYVAYLFSILLKVCAHICELQMSQYEIRDTLIQYRIQLLLFLLLPYHNQFAPKCKLFMPTTTFFGPNANLQLILSLSLSAHPSDPVFVVLFCLLLKRPNKYSVEICRCRFCNRVVQLCLTLASLFRI